MNIFGTTGIIVISVAVVVFCLIGLFVIKQLIRMAYLAMLGFAGYMVIRLFVLNGQVTDLTQAKAAITDTGLTDHIPWAQLEAFQTTAGDALKSGLILQGFGVVITLMGLIADNRFLEFGGPIVFGYATTWTDKGLEAYHTVRQVSGEQAVNWMLSAIVLIALLLLVFLRIRASRRRRSQRSAQLAAV